MDFDAIEKIPKQYKDQKRKQSGYLDRKGTRK
jgi:hypothetical protein